MTERWRAIPGLPKLYLVSDRGRVFSIRREIFMQPTKTGYVALHFKGETLNRKVDGLVKAAFPLALRFQPRRSQGTPRDFQETGLGETG